jgi:hypothetical protein
MASTGHLKFRHAEENAGKQHTKSKPACQIPHRPSAADSSEGFRLQPSEPSRSNPKADCL